MSINWIDFTRLIAITGVLFVHVAASVINAYQPGSYEWWVGNFFDSLVRWCVPLFVMVSGFLLLDSKKDESALEFYKRRLNRILVPIIAWSVIFTFWNAARSFFTHGYIDVSMLLEKISY